MNQLTIQNYPYNKEVNGVFTPKRADFAIWIETGTWEEYGPNYNYTIRGGLGIEVDENSGGDGYVAPNLSFPPLEHISPFTSVNDLIGKKIVEKWKNPFKDDYRYFYL